MVLESFGDDHKHWINLLAQPLMRRTSESLAMDLKSRPGSINILLSIVQHAERVIASRASWVLGHLWDMDPKSLVSNQSEIVAIILNTENDSIRRNFLRIIIDFDLDDTELMALFEPCIQWMVSEKHAVAVRCNAMQVLYLTCLRVPELSHEVRAHIQSCQAYGSSAFKARGNTIIKSLIALEKGYNKD
jgi:hypothetical protein